MKNVREDYEALLLLLRCIWSHSKQPMKLYADGRYWSDPVVLEKLSKAMGPAMAGMEQVEGGTG